MNGIWVFSSHNMQLTLCHSFKVKHNLYEQEDDAIQELIFELKAKNASGDSVTLFKQHVVGCNLTKTATLVKMNLAGLLEEIGYLIASGEKVIELVVDEEKGKSLFGSDHSIPHLSARKFKKEYN